jgi:uncharacterized cupin superfamily protein
VHRETHDWDQLDQHTREVEVNAYSLMESDDTWVPFEVGRVKWLRQDDDVQAGIWACEPREIPERNPTNFDRDETIVILGGRLTVEIEDGPTVELGPGDSASFVKGSVGRWTVHESVKEFFVYS